MRQAGGRVDEPPLQPGRGPSHDRVPMDEIRACLDDGGCCRRWTGGSHREHGPGGGIPTGPVAVRHHEGTRVGFCTGGRSADDIDPAVVVQVHELGADGGTAIPVDLAEANPGLEGSVTLAEENGLRKEGCPVVAGHDEIEDAIVVEVHGLGHARQTGTEGPAFGEVAVAFSEPDFRTAGELSAGVVEDAIPIEVAEGAEQGGDGSRANHRLKGAIAVAQEHVEVAGARGGVEDRRHGDIGFFVVVDIADQDMASNDPVGLNQRVEAGRGFEGGVAFSEEDPDRAVEIGCGNIELMVAVEVGDRKQSGSAESEKPWHLKGGARFCQTGCASPPSRSQAS